MTDLFPLDESGFGGEGAGTAPQRLDPGEVLDAVHPPISMLACAYATLIASLLCFAPATKVFNYVGYALAGVLVAVLVIFYRSIDRRRRRSSRYVFRRYDRVLATIPLALGILAAAGHAYFIAQTKSVA